MKSSTFICWMLAIILVSCEEKKYLAADAVVVETKLMHWGKGYYNLDVYYRYFNGSDTVVGNSIAKGKESVQTARYIEGDSVRVGFNPKDGTDTYIIRRIYSVPRYKGRFLH